MEETILNDYHNPVFVVERGRLVSIAKRYSRAACLVPVSDETVIASPDNNLSHTSTNYVAPLTWLTCSVLCRHFSRIDSLVGLPEDLGRLLFKATLHYDLYKCDKPLELLNILRIFSEAYNEVFCSRLDLSGINACQQESTISVILPPLSYALTELRMDKCRLDSVDKSFLTYIGGLTHLRHLSLQGNGLWDERLRILTANWRYSRQKTRIEKIDLRDNHLLSAKCVRFFIDIRSLQQIAFSLTTDLEDEFPYGDCSKRRWRLTRRAPCFNFMNGTDGWLSEILEVWVKRKDFPNTQSTISTEDQCLLLLRRSSEQEVDNSLKYAVSERKRLKVDEDHVNSEENKVIASYRL